MYDDLTEEEQERFRVLGVAMMYDDEGIVDVRDALWYFLHDPGNRLDSGTYTNTFDGSKYSDPVVVTEQLLEHILVKLGGPTKTNYSQYYGTLETYPGML